MYRSRIAPALVAFVTVVGLLGVLPSEADAIGLLIPQRSNVRPFDIESHRVDVKITNNAAVTEIEQVFRNHTNRPQEATFVFPLPEGATVSDFSLWINGKKTKGAVLKKDKARQIYQSIVQRTQDPGLVEYVDGRLFRASVFPIPAGGTQKLELKFSQVLERRGGFYRYNYPMGTGEKYVKAETEKDFTLSVDIKSPIPISSVYSPTHRISTDRRAKGEVLVGTEKMQARLDRDFKLYIGQSKRDIGLNMMTYDPDGDGGTEGYFMAALAPPIDEKETGEVPQSFTFVVDTSGSMNGDKIEQARKTLEFCIERLKKTDRFNVVRFSTGVELLFDSPTSATEKARRKGVSFARGLEAAGGTAISSALDRALDQEVPEEFVHHVIFVTDGIPTIGKTNPDTILKDVRSEVGGSTRIFSFGVGYDVNTKLTDGLARDGRGHSDYVKPGENLEDAVSALYTRISSPVLTDVEIDFGGAEVHDIYPNPVPDLFQGDQIVLFGRNRAAFDSAIVVEGRAAGERRRFEFGGSTDSEEEKTEAGASIASSELDFIPELWATRKVGYLLEQIRINGENSELKNEVVRLAKKFGLVTPYTSYLAVDDEELERRRRRRRRPPPPPPPRPESERGRSMDDLSSRTVTGGSGGSTAADESAPSAQAKKRPRKNKAEAFSGFDRATGSSAVRAAEETQEYKEREQVARKGQLKKRFIAGRTFERHGSEWRQEGIGKKSLKKAVEVEAYSKKYFELLDKHPAFKSVAKLGERFVVKLGGKVYRIVPAEE